MENRITSEDITTLNENEIFVFGSNLSGIHGAGAAKKAQEFGAVWGKGVGLFGQTYAIPTKDYGVIRTLTINEIERYVDSFIIFAMNNPDKVFLVTKIGCGLAGHSISDVAKLFSMAKHLKNIHLPIEFWEVINQ